MSYRIQPDQRRNHIAQLIGSDLISIDWINENNDILNDVYSLNLNFPNGIKERWKEIDIVNPTSVKKPFLFVHASALAVQGELQNAKNFHYINIFFLGKIKSNGNRGLSNDLYALVVGKKPSFWKRFDDAKELSLQPDISIVRVIMKDEIF